ncbi:hypothetical protein EYC84_006946 [Monilinia fructicola]|uniref:G-patch domain-containing protein n=1 Tax=Monilinia fructicola TaxID=38448 RepID=A0A5M9K9H6_MONFR|nr:hypothetical protein EYC84_006946 [Monilinia fructicola]
MTGDDLRITEASNGAAQDEEEEDDYMNMIIAEPTQPREKETYTQRRQRIQRESEARSRTKSKAEMAAEEAAAREAALSKSMLAAPESAQSKGLKMMAKMGFKPGVALGRRTMWGRGWSRCLEEVEREGKRVKAEEGEYRERVRKEREEGRLEGMVGAAMRVAERMDGEREEEEEERIVVSTENGETGKDQDQVKRKISTKPLKQINILWRGLVRKREEKERDRRMRYDLQQSLSRLPTYDDADEDKDDKRALGKDKVQHTMVEDLEEEDPELDAFNLLEPAERLRMLVEHLRSQYNYCFFCKFKYPNDLMDGCPGLTEEDHD